MSKGGNFSVARTTGTPVSRTSWVNYRTFKKVNVWAWFISRSVSHLIWSRCPTISLPFYIIGTQKVHNLHEEVHTKCHINNHIYVWSISIQCLHFHVTRQSFELHNFLKSIIIPAWYKLPFTVEEKYTVSLYKVSHGLPSLYFFEHVIPITRVVSFHGVRSRNPSCVHWRALEYQCLTLNKC